MECYTGQGINVNFSWLTLMQFSNLQRKLAKKIEKVIAEME